MATDDTEKTEYEPRNAELLIAALLGKPTIQQAAKEAGISERTAIRWMQEPDFQKSYREARRAVVETAIAALQQRCVIASATLVEIAQDKSKPGSVRVSAARSILEFSLRGVEMLDLETRLAEIEQRLPEKSK